MIYTVGRLQHGSADRKQVATERGETGRAGGKVGVNQEKGSVYVCRHAIARLLHLPRIGEGGDVLVLMCCWDELSCVLPK